MSAKAIEPNVDTGKTPLQHAVGFGAHGHVFEAGVVGGGQGE